ncbi:hypothetical protein MKEN_01194000 [Mycena kentingensis (nom. inval.)]|nr:hypothetical protein MKEN_01194000 [Mycena kentingensis (nom. inval.)]
MSPPPDHHDAHPHPPRVPPQFIALPPPPAFAQRSSLAVTPPFTPDDPLASPLWSPAIELYHTAPSTPIVSPAIEVPSQSNPVAATSAPHRPAESPAAGLHITIPGPTDAATEVHVEDAFPTVEIPMDLVDDEGLTALEKIYLFARSQSVYHRLFITHALPSFLEQVSPQEALEYVQPLLQYLALDEDERVKEALVGELVAIIWWFFTNCRIVPEPETVEQSVEESLAAPEVVRISVQKFTPMLGTLLLSPNNKVGAGTRYVIVNLLARMRKLDQRESGSPLLSPTPTADSDEANEEDDIPVGLFGREERLLFKDQLLQQLVIGMGWLDEDDVAQEEPTPEDSPPPAITVADAHDEDLLPEISSPDAPKLPGTSPRPTSGYFPDLPYSVPSPGSSNSSTPSSTTDTSSSSSSASGSRPPYPTPSPPSTGRRSRPSSNPSSPFNENAPVPSATASPRQRGFFISTGSSDAGTDDRATEATEDGEADQGSMGRLSSMSLMAAVTASGCVDDATKNAFVKEVERVSQDPVYWVRREASYALGALAKVVPDEIVVLSLIPLFDALRRDSQWPVRQSALFALPAILSRLKPGHRRKLALETVPPLAGDDSPPVRSGMLELLGEILYTFHEDPNGPPEELVHLFLGRRDDKRVRDGQQAVEHRDQIISSLFGRPVRPEQPSAPSPLTAFFTDPARPLICAFNFPAVAMALGRDRWGELRQTYLEIAENPEVGVRRSLAASLGEMAKIIGAQQAERDLMQVWWVTVASQEEEVRERALEAAEIFVSVLKMPARLQVVTALVSSWDSFRGWRERKAIAKALVGLGAAIGREDPKPLRDLLKQALEDSVAAVREAAISALPQLWTMFAADNDVLASLRADVDALSRSDIYRHRMTFVACLQSLLLSDRDNISEDKLWEMVPSLADDAVVGVRIGVARLVGLASDRSRGGSAFLVDLIRHLCLDASPDVRAYVQGSSTPQPAAPTHRSKFATFSRPPPSSSSLAGSALAAASPSINTNPPPPPQPDISYSHSPAPTSGKPESERAVRVLA